MIAPVPVHCFSIIFFPKENVVVPTYGIRNVTAKVMINDLNDRSPSEQRTIAKERPPNYEGCTRNTRKGIRERRPLQVADGISP